MTYAKNIFIALTLILALAISHSAEAATAKEIDRDAREALQKLYKHNELAASLAGKSKAVLVFPNIVKAGLIFGGSYGEGALITAGKTEAYYNSVSGSWGLQAGAQSYGYVVFLITDSAVKSVHKTKGWEVGVGPTVVIVDEGVAKNLSTTTLKDDAYAFIFGQQGLMAGISLEGSKISKIKR
ncbi:MAG: twin-arginine translocation pathway signal protein [Alphaproteobacteria bacterium]|nr:MAG: twin-arginine translocation pathway signal protein [Alphaproteobacteria bacterium]